MEVESVTESVISDQQATPPANVEKSPVIPPRNPRQGKKKPQFMLPMADIPEGKKTSSRAGIKRQVTLKSRATQDLFFRVYGFLSDSHYFLEIVAPGIAASHPDKPDYAIQVKQFRDLTRENMNSVRDSIGQQILMVREAMENNGIDPDSNAMAFTEPLNEEAIITSHLDSEFLGILENLDVLVGLRGVGSIFSIFGPEEVSTMERSSRRELLSIYRNALRNSRIAMQSAMGHNRPPRPKTERTESTDSASPDTSAVDTDLSSTASEVSESMATASDTTDALPTVTEDTADNGPAESDMDTTNEGTGHRRSRKTTALAEEPGEPA